MVCLGRMEELRKKMDMAKENSSLVISPEVLEKALSEVFYKSSVKEIMKLVRSVDGVETERTAKIVVQVTDEEREWFAKAKEPHDWENRGRRSALVGGVGSYRCKKCGASARTSFACLPRTGCKGTKE